MSAFTGRCTSSGSVSTNRLYPLYPEGWNAGTQAFTPQFQTYLAQVSPDFCFPLTQGATWKTGGDWAWRVDGHGPVAEGPQDVPAGAIRLVEEMQGGPFYVWFERGVGPVAAWSSHHGTYTEFIEKLTGR